MEAKFGKGDIIFIKSSQEKIFAQVMRVDGAYIKWWDGRETDYCMNHIATLVCRAENREDRDV